jgi:hypothetical protein
MKLHTTAHMPPWGWIAVGALLLVQSIWLFYDARKRGLRPWFWGLWGLIQAPIPTIVYLLLARKIFRKSKI